MKLSCPAPSSRRCRGILKKTVSDWNNECLCEFHTMSRLKVHRRNVASEASVFWHSLTPVAMKTAAPPSSTFPTSVMMDRKWHGRNVRRRFDGGSSVPFPGSSWPLDRHTATFQLSSDRTCFNHRLKNDLEVGREGFQVWDVRVGRCWGSGDEDQEEDLGSGLVDRSWGAD